MKINKSKNKKYIRDDGFRSKLEGQIYKQLPKKRTEYEKERLKYFIPKTYVPDFTYTTKTGHKIYIEVKGYLRYEDQIKMRYVKIANPELDIRIVFATDNKIGSGKMTNSQWCLKYGFPYAIGKIPRSWKT